MRICICGGGHLGHVVAGFLASQPENRVAMLTRRPHDWADTLTITDLDGKTYRGGLWAVTDSVEEALHDTDIVLLCLPGYSISETLLRIKDFLPPSAAVGSIVSSTGFFFQAFKLLPATQTLFGFQRVPFIARTREYGHSADLLGYKPSLNIAIEHCDDKEQLRKTIESLFRCPVCLMHSHYEVSLTNSNPILHTSRLYSLWKDYEQGRAYDAPPMFYGDWDDGSSALLIAMDNEFQRLLEQLPVRKGAIPTILDYYESSDASSLTRKLCSIRAFGGIVAPMMQTPKGWVPDFTSRYFTEDFPFGLKFIHDTMRQQSLASPVIDRVLEWGLSKAGHPII